MILLRHPRPDVAEGVCYGATDLECADDVAAIEACVAGLPPVDRVVSSPLRRCLALGSIVAGRFRLPLTVDERLREMDFGCWEGRPWADIARAEVDAWAADFHDARPHGGESVAMLAARVGGALAALRAMPGTTLAVTHLGVIRAALAASKREDGWRAQVSFCQSVTLEDDR